ncbi:MAG: VOC family protein [Anaerolineales bacterium]
MTMQTTGVIETCLYVDDLDAAQTFYEDVLGLPAFSKVGGRHVFLRSDTGVVLLFNPNATEKGGDVPAHGARGPGHVAFAMRPEDVDAWRQHLRAHGVEIETDHAWPRGGRSLYFRDPAGNSVELVTPDTWGLV